MKEVGVSTKVRESADVTVGVPGHIDHTEEGVDVLDGMGVSTQRRGRGVDIGGSVWRFLISMRTGLWVILILGILTLAGTLLMQASPEAVADPATYQSWYESGPQLKYGGWAPILSALGFFRIFTTWYFLALFGLLAASILACSINRAPRLWRVATRPRTSMSDAFYSHAPLSASFDLPVDVDEASAQVAAGLNRDRFRVLAAPTKGGADLYADKFRWGPFGTVVAHLSFVIIMAGFVVSGTLGFKDDSFIAPVGVPVEVGHGTGLTLTAMSFNDSYYDDGSPKDYVADITLSRDGQQVARQDVRVNDPLRLGGVWFHQAFFGVGADIKATSGGQTVFAKTVPLQWKSTDGQQSIGQFEIPSAKVSVYVIEAASGQVLADLPAGTVALEVHTDGVEDPTVQLVEQGKSTVINGVTYAFDRNRQYTGLTVSEDPGSWVVWLGSILLILGSCLVFFFPHRRVWARVRRNADGTSHVDIAAPLKRDPTFEPDFADIVSRIQGTSV